MASRKIEDLVPELQTLYYKFKEEMDKLGIKFIITCTARNLKEQVALYAQGRQSLQEVNDLRKIAGLTPITATENKHKVTWTLKSKHIVNWDDSDKTNDKAKAFDIVIVKDGKANYDLKVDVNKDNRSDYMQAGEIGKKVGLVWGGDWKSPDYPHFEIKS